MPIYEYVCYVCGKKQELFCDINNSLEEIACSFCNNKAKKVISASRIKSETRGMFGKKTRK